MADAIFQVVDSLPMITIISKLHIQLKTVFHSGANILMGLK